MKLYFTGPAVHEDPQPSSLLSLGGYPSSSPVPRIGLNKLFGPISQKDLNVGGKSTKAVVLKNETGNAVVGAMIYYTNDSQSPVTNFKIALVTLATDSCGKLSMESITSPQDTPASGIFIDSLGSTNALTLPDIVAGEYLGIWIERSINPIKGQQQLTCEYLLDAHIAATTENVAHIVDISIDALTAADEYFTFDTIQGQYVVWLKDALTVIPSIASSHELLIVDVSGLGTVNLIASAINDKLQQIVVPRGEITSTVTNNIVTITNIQSGKVSTPFTSTGDVTLAVTAQGTTNSVEVVEDTSLVITY
jgi:hypothetical protein